MPNLQLYPGEYQIQDGPNKGKIQTNPTSLLMRRNRFTSTIPPIGGTGSITTNGITEWQLPQSDFLESLELQIQGSIATNGGTYTTVTFVKYPNKVPFGLIKRFSIYANGGQTTLMSLSGWGLYVYCRQRNDVALWPTGTNDKFDTATQAILGSAAQASQTRAFSGGTVAGSTTYGFAQSYHIPIAFNQFGDYGLMVLQNKSPIRVRIEWGNLTATGGNDIFVETSASGTGYTLTGTARLSGHYIKWLPPDVFEYSRQTSMLKTVTEQTYSFNNGTNIIQLQRNDIYSWIWYEVYNNGDVVAETTLSNLQLYHSNKEVLFSEDRYTALSRMYHEHDGLWPLDASQEYMLNRRQGLLHRADILDSIDDSEIQNLSIAFDFDTTSITGTSGVRVLTESLIAAQQ